MKLKYALCISLLALLGIPSFGAGNPPRFVKSADVDLNGDGKKEHVKIDMPSGYTGDFTLHVDGMSVKGELAEGLEGFRIVDIDTSDHYKEIAVFTDGPSDDPAYKVYWYDGKSIAVVGSLEWAEFPGNGTVLVTTRIDFAFTTEKYALNKRTHKLDVVPQDIYYVLGPDENGWKSLEVTVAKSFPVRFSRTSSQVIANLQPGKKITIIGYSPAKRDASGGILGSQNDQYLIKSSSNLMGWVSAKQLYENSSDLPAFD